MDAIAYAHADKQQQRIKKVIAEPDSTSGLVTMPSTIAVGETVTIPAGRTVVHPNLQVDGTLDIQGDLFIPSGGSVTQTLVDATVVKQNGNVVANDIAVVHKSGDTMTGNLNFSGIDAQIGTSTNNSLILKTNDTEKVRVDTSGNVLVTGSGGLGYGTGSGGTVTQLTSKATAVTLNKPCGQIIMNNASLAANTSVAFNLTNSLISINDIVALNVETVGGVTRDAYNVWACPYIGGTEVHIRNISGTARSEAVVINYSVIKGATA